MGDLARARRYRATQVVDGLCRPARAACACLLAGASAACIVVPQTRTVYDPECKMHTRQITLEAAYLGGFHSCAGDGCMAMLAAVGVVTAASVVVSGSIALVGNVVYWIERQGRCPRAPASSTAVP